MTHFPFSRPIFARKRHLYPTLVAAFFLAVVLLLAAGQVRSEDATCHGKFPNYITDVCYSGMFPISIFGQEIMSMGQDDCSPYTGGAGFCTCLGKGGNTVFGVPTSFTEYSRMVDVTYTPYCFPLLGGERINAGPGETLYSPSAGGVGGEVKSDSGYWFGNVNFYVNPLMALLGSILDSDCTDKSAFDLAWISPLDPTWVDTQLNLLTTPYAFAFANPIAAGASAYDCVSASVGCPVSSMIWSSGCNGHALPFTGHVSSRVSGDQVGRLLTHRIIAHMHAMGVMWGRWGEEGLCGYYPMPIMDKGAYKTQRILHIPQTKKVNGKCADPIGRTTVGSGGYEVPVIGKDFSYLVGVKRDCCSGVGVR